MVKMQSPLTVADDFAFHMLPLIHFAVLRRMDRQAIYDLMEIWVEFNTGWYRHADLTEPEIVQRLRKIMADYGVTGFVFSPDEFPVVEQALCQCLEAVLQARAAEAEARGRNNAAEPYQFVVFAAEEGLEQVPKVKIVVKEVANDAFAETGGRPEDDRTYGTSRWDYTHVRFTAGCHASAAEALEAAVTAALKLQDEVDRVHQEQLDQAQSAEERKEISRYHRSCRQVHLECGRRPGGNSLDSPWPIRTLAKDRRKHDQFARKVEQFFCQDKTG